jgi:hypothetical protein
MECSVCANPFNLSNHAKVPCFACALEVCKTCVRTFLTTSGALPKCLGCGAAFQQSYLVRHLNRSWVQDTYRPCYQEVLFKAELAKMPETVPQAEAEVERRRLAKINEEFTVRINKMHAQIARYSNAIVANRYRMRGEEVPPRYLNDLVDGGRVEVDAKKKFVMACPGAGCRGFLSTAYKCALCSKSTCADCLAVLDVPRAEHACVESDRLSAELIKKDTRPCPTCGERIFKVSGCDQMYCTNAGSGTVCGTAFSWKTGAIERGQIHNPHFYELQRQTGGLMRNPGDVQCGGMPDLRPIIRVLDKLMDLHDHGETAQTNLRVRAAHRCLCELTQYAVNEMRVKIRALGDTAKLRVQYILNELTPGDLQLALYRQKRDLNKYTDIYHVLEIMSISGIECFIDMAGSMPSASAALQLAQIDPAFTADLNKNLARRLETLDTIREYCNEQLKQISITYACTVRQFAPNYHQISRKFNMSGLAVGEGVPV